MSAWDQLSDLSGQSEPEALPEANADIRAQQGLLMRQGAPSPQEIRETSEPPQRMTAGQFAARSAVPVYTPPVNSTWSNLGNVDTDPRPAAGETYDDAANRIARIQQIQQQQDDQQARAQSRADSLRFRQQGTPVIPGLGPVTDQTGAPLTQKLRGGNIAYDSQGNPVDYSQRDTSGYPILRDPYSTVPVTTDPQTGDMYRQHPQLGWQWVGKDDQVAQNAQYDQQNKLDTAASSALAGTESQTAKLAREAAAKAKLSTKNTAKTLSGLGIPLTDDSGQPIDLTQADPDELKAHIEDAFNQRYATPEANDTHLFGGGYTPDALALRHQIDQDKLKAMQAVDSHFTTLQHASDTQDSLDAIQQQRQQLTSGKLDAVNRKRVAAGLEPITPAIPGLGAAGPAGIPGLEDNQTATTGTHQWLSDHSDKWNQQQQQLADDATAAGMPQVPVIPSDGAARTRIIDAINRAESAGYKVPHFIGQSFEPTGDRSVAMDADNLVNALQKQESDLRSSGKITQAEQVAKEAGYWKRETSAGGGMTNAEWGEADPKYPAQEMTRSVNGASAGQAPVTGIQNTLERTALEGAHGFEKGLEGVIQWSKALPKWAQYLVPGANLIAKGDEATGAEKFLQQRTGQQEAALAGDPNTPLGHQLAPAGGVGSTVSKVVGGLIGQAPGIAMGGIPGLVALGTQSAAQGSAEAHDAAKAQGMSDDDATKAGTLAAIKTLPSTALFAFAGGATSKALSKILPLEATPITRAAAALVSGTAANLVAGAAGKGVVGENPTPTIDDLVNSVIFAAHGSMTEHQVGQDLATARSIVNGTHPEMAVMDGIAEGKVPQATPQQQASAAQYANALRAVASKYIEKAGYQSPEAERPADIPQPAEKQAQAREVTPEISVQPPAAQEQPAGVAGKTGAVIPGLEQEAARTPETSPSKEPETPSGLAQPAQPDESALQIRVTDATALRDQAAREGNSIAAAYQDAERAKAQNQLNQLRVQTVAPPNPPTNTAPAQQQPAEETPPAAELPTPSIPESTAKEGTVSQTESAPVEPEVKPESEQAPSWSQVEGGGEPATPGLKEPTKPYSAVMAQEHAPSTPEQKTEVAQRLAHPEAKEVLDRLKKLRGVTIADSPTGAVMSTNPDNGHVTVNTRALGHALDHLQGDKAKQDYVTSALDEELNHQAAIIAVPHKEASAIGANLSPEERSALEGLYGAKMPDHVAGYEAIRAFMQGAKGNPTEAFHLFTEKAKKDSAFRSAIEKALKFIREIASKIKSGELKNRLSEAIKKVQAVLDGLEEKPVEVEKPAEKPVPKVEPKEPVKIAKEPAKAEKPLTTPVQASDVKPAAEVLHTAKQVKLIVPKGATFIRATPAKGNPVVEHVNNVGKGDNVLQGAGPYKKVEAGAMDRKGKFIAVPGDVLAVDKTPLASASPDSPEQSLRNAYDKIVSDKERNPWGFPDVHISDVIKEAGIPLDEGKKLIRSLRGKGVQIASGDWSLANDEQKAAGIDSGDSRGGKDLLMHFESKESTVTPNENTRINSASEPPDSGASQGSGKDLPASRPETWDAARTTEAIRRASDEVKKGGAPIRESRRSDEISGNAWFDLNDNEIVTDHPSLDVLGKLVHERGGDAEKVIRLTVGEEDAHWRDFNASGRDISGQLQRRVFREIPIPVKIALYHAYGQTPNQHGGAEIIRMLYQIRHGGEITESAAPWRLDKANEMQAELKKWTVPDWLSQHLDAMEKIGNKEPLAASSPSDTPEEAPKPVGAPAVRPEGQQGLNAPGETSEEDSGRPEDGKTASEKLIRQAEQAGVSYSMDTLKGMIRGDKAAMDKVRAMIREKGGTPLAVSSPSWDKVNSTVSKLKDASGFTSVVDDVQKALSPDSRLTPKEREEFLKSGDPNAIGDARKTSILLDGVTAAMDRRKKQWEDALKGAKALVDKLPEKQQKELMLRMDEGTPLKPGPYRDAMETILKEDAKKVYEAKAWFDSHGQGHWVNYENYLKNVVPRQFEDPDLANKVMDGYLRARKMQGGTGWLKHRQDVTMREIMDYAEQQGTPLKPKHTNVVDAIMDRWMQQERYFGAHDMIAKMESHGIGHWEPTDYEGVAGEKQVNNVIGQRVVEVPKEGREDDETTRKKQYFWAHEPAAQIINNYLSRGLRADRKWVENYFTAANALNSAQLGLSFFHGGFVTMEGMVSSFSLGIQKALSGDMSGLKDMALAPFSTWHDWKLGGKIRDEMLNPGKYGQQMQSVVNSMVEGGFRDGLDSFYQDNHISKMLSAFRDKRYVPALLRAPMALIEAAAKPIMEHFVPRMKAAAVYKLAEMHLKQNPNITPMEMRRRLQEDVRSGNNRFGQMTYDNLHLHKIVKDLLMMATRSLGWNWGTFSEIGGGLHDWAKFIPRAGKAAFGKGDMPMVTNKMAYTLGLPILVGALGAALSAMLGQKIKDPKDLYFVKTGDLDERGNPIRVSLPSYMKDVFHAANDPKSTITNKLHPLLSTLGDMLRNKDFYGVEIRHAGDPVMKQILQELGYAGKQFVPFTARNTTALREAKAPIGLQLAGLVGVTKAPASVNKSSAQALADQINSDSRPTAARTSEQADASKLRGRLTGMIRAGNGQAELSTALRNGDITPTQARAIQHAASMTTLQASVSHLGLNDAERVYEKATPEEKRQLEPVMVAKRGRAIPQHKVAAPMSAWARLKAAA